MHCQCHSAKCQSMQFLDNFNFPSNSSCCKTQNPKPSNQDMKKSTCLHHRSHHQLEESFDFEMFSQIQVDNQTPFRSKLKRSFHNGSEFGQRSMISNISNANSGIKLGLKVIYSKIELLQKKRAAFRLFRHIKITQFVFKLNYIVKVNLFLNLQSCFLLIKARNRFVNFWKGFRKFARFIESWKKIQKAKVFLRVKLLKNK